jgi:hypothetical protein
MAVTVSPVSGAACGGAVGVGAGVGRCTQLASPTATIAAINELFLHHRIARENTDDVA